MVIRAAACRHHLARGGVRRQRRGLAPHAIRQQDLEEPAKTRQRKRRPDEPGGETDTVVRTVEGRGGSATRPVLVLWSMHAPTGADRRLIGLHPIYQ